MRVVYGVRGLRGEVVALGDVPHEPVAEAVELREVVVELVAAGRIAGQPERLAVVRVLLGGEDLLLTVVDWEEGELSGKEIDE